MNTGIDIPWNRYALLAELTRRLDTVSPQFGKTALQKHFFFLQEIYSVDCGYDFELYSYGPFAAQMLSDLDLVEYWGYVSVVRIDDTLGGYRIRPTEKTDLLCKKAENFLNDQKIKQSLDDLVNTYGKMTARELELRATTAYVAKALLTKNEEPTREIVCSLVSKLKPKFTQHEIEQVITELHNRGHIQLAEPTRAAIPHRHMADEK